MKTIIAFLFISIHCFSQTFEVVPLSGAGSDKRIKIAILGDGFTAAEQDDFMTSARSLLDTLFSRSPFSEYKNYFSAYGIKVISAESGVKHPGTASGETVTTPWEPITNPDNYLGSTFDTYDIHRCMYSYNSNKIEQVLLANIPDYDIPLIIGNSTVYGGCGGWFATASRSPSSGKIATHELGHTFGKLEDEYWTITGESINKTQNSDPATIKWKNWIGIQGIGIYPFTEDPTWFRPHENCHMRSLYYPFCSVCKEGIIEKIHTLLSPVDSYTPSNTSSLDATSPVTFTVNEILPVPNTLVNSWKLNNITLPSTGNTLTLNPSQLNAANNTLIFSVTDGTSLVNVDGHNTLHVTNIIWSLNTSTLHSMEITAEEKRYELYPNPTEGIFYIKGRQNFKKDVKVEVYDTSGKLMNAQFMQKDPLTLTVNIRNLPAGMYVINVKENKELMISQKMIKE
ncbi:M64 family metallopeptidase [Chryseobacterium sp. RRHN12]|uniref:T9SS type A sorting domain-containing protein n=1 Tax=Chryseobacterium sp. RRHN12 TaxID=3437884 RepID=UPI003D9AF03C